MPKPNAILGPDDPKTQHRAPKRGGVFTRCGQEHSQPQALVPPALLPVLLLVLCGHWAVCEDACQRLNLCWQPSLHVLGCLSCLAEAGGTRRTKAREDAEEGAVVGCAAGLWAVAV